MRMNEFPFGSNEDREMLASMPKERLVDLFFLHIRNLWRVDGLYFLGIEKRFNTETATEIDAEVWKTMAIIEAKGLKKMFQIGDNPNVSTIMDCLRKSSWALDQPPKVIEVDSKRAVLRITKSRTQETRRNKGLCEFPCKEVRFAYLRNFAKTLNPNVEVNCILCPPDTHPEEYWCEWEFRL
jgi:hypothetical protein